jgi:competence protein ComEA
MSKIHVYVKTPLKRNGKIIPPSDEAIELPADEAKSLIAVGAVVPRDLAAPSENHASESGDDPSGSGSAGGEPNEKTPGAGDPGGNDPASSGKAPGAVNINQATAAELAKVNGVGEEIASAIVALREKDGPFQSLDGLTAISGIGKATVKKLADHLTV